MSDVLSQNEIDSLLSGMSTGALSVEDVVTPVRKAEDNIAAYDFRRPNRLSKNQLRTLQTVHESFAEAFTFHLVSKLQSLVSVSVTSVDQLFYSEFVLSIANPSCLYVFDIIGTDGSGILEISPQLAFSLVERLLGGASDSASSSRAITQIEQAVIRGIIERALSDLSGSWRSLGDLGFRFSRFETEADFVQIAPGSEIVLIVSFDVNIGSASGSSSYLMNLCFPTFALEEVIAQLNRRQLTAGMKTSSEKLRENEVVVQRQLAKTHLPVVAELGRAQITVRDLLEMKTGDIIKLNTRIDQELQLMIAGQRKLAVRPGTVNGKRAVRVMRKLVDQDIIEE